MLQIHCPYCQEYREEEEFSYAGQAHIERPSEPESLTDQQWAQYLFFRKNPRGLHHEMWYHIHGCKQFFNVCRHTVTYQIISSYKIGDTPELVQSKAVDKESINAN